jgi:hypothetical protein
VGCIVENPGVFFSIFLTDQSSMFAVHIIGMLVKDLRLSSLSERGYPDNTANSFLVCLYILEIEQIKYIYNMSTVLCVFHQEIIPVKIIDNKNLRKKTLSSLYFVLDSLSLYYLISISSQSFTKVECESICIAYS